MDKYCKRFIGIGTVLLPVFEREMKRGKREPSARVRIFPPSKLDPLFSFLFIVKSPESTIYTGSTEL